MLLLARLASAQDSVLWYDDDSRTVSTLEATVLAAGADAFDQTPTWPGDLSDYRLVFLVVPAAAFSATETADIEDFVASGSTLVLVGDSTAYSGSSLGYFDTLLGDLGMTTTWGSGGLDSGCSNTATVVSTHPFVDGLSGPVYAATSDLSLGSGAEMLLEGASGQSVLAVEENVVMSTDINVFDDSCTLNSDNELLFENLFSGSCGTPDRDGDGYDSEWCEGDDCDDGDPDAHPGATWYLDYDGDGFGDAASTTEDCEPPSGYVADATDCDDTDRSTWPGASETCNDIDDDCDGTIDDDAIDGSTWYLDADGDGFGTIADAVILCDEPEGYANNTRDCDDEDAAAWPGADEVCDGTDDDCDGTLDEDAIDAPSWYPDADGDGYGDATQPTAACEAPDGFLADASDCDDTDEWVRPGADEYCDDRDEDCDGTVDEDALNTTTWYADADGDGYGDAAATTEACDEPEGYGLDATDCDDADPALALDCEADSSPPVEEEEEAPTEDKTGCGCGTPAHAGGFAVLLALGMARRRRPTSTP